MYPRVSNSAVSVRPLLHLWIEELDADLRARLAMLSSEPAIQQNNFIVGQPETPAGRNGPVAVRPGDSNPRRSDENLLVAGKAYQRRRRLLAQPRVGFRQHSQSPSPWVWKDQLIGLDTEVFLSINLAGFRPKSSNESHRSAVLSSAVARPVEGGHWLAAQHRRTRVEEIDGNEDIQRRGGLGVRLKSFPAESAVNTPATVNSSVAVTSDVPRFASDDERGRSENRSTPSFTRSPTFTPSFPATRSDSATSFALPVQSTSPSETPGGLNR